MPELTVPVVGVHVSYLAAIGEYRAEGGYPDFDNLEVEHPERFAAYVRGLRADPRTNPDADWPPMTLLWWVDGGSYLGRISIWHRQDGALADSGHIGYDIRPSARGRGHATAMLGAALPVIAQLGINPAVVIVRANNPASRRVLEANGARLVEDHAGRLRFDLPTMPSN
jgi:predicted acetyltransferase